MLERLRSHRTRGQDLVEYALVLPVLMLMLLGIIEFSVIVWSYDTIASAAREGARYGIIHPEEATPGGKVEALVRARALGLPGALAVTPSEDGEAVEVEVTYDTVPLTPFVPSLQLRTIATMLIEN